MPIIVVGLVSQVAIGLIATANELFDLKASQDIETILIVVLFGIGTDYILFFLFRYRERLREGEEKRPAVAHALERAGEAIASAGGAVIVAFMALVLSLARDLPVDRPGAGHRGRGDAPGRAHPGPGRRDRAGPRAVLAVEEVPRRARGRPVRGGRAIGGPPPGPLRAGLRRGARPAGARRVRPSTPPSTSASAAPRARPSRRWRCKTLEKGFPAGATDPTTGAASLDRRRASSSADELTAYQHGARRARRCRPGRSRPAVRGRHRRLVQRLSSRTTPRPTPRSPR